MSQSRLLELYSATEINYTLGREPAARSWIDLALVHQVRRREFKPDSPGLGTNSCYYAQELGAGARQHRAATCSESRIKLLTLCRAKQTKISINQKVNQATGLIPL